MIDRYYVRRVVGKVYYVDPNVPLYEVMDRLTKARVEFDVFESREVADRQAALYNNGEGPIDYHPRLIRMDL